MMTCSFYVLDHDFATFHRKNNKRGGLDEGHGRNKQFLLWKWEENLFPCPCGKQCETTDTRREFIGPIDLEKGPFSETRD